MRIGGQMVEFRINGVKRKVDTDPRTPLQWVIRDILKLRGTKFGCGGGQCGACTVHVNEDAVRSCVFPIQAAEAASITTIEGLDPNHAHPLQVKWIEKKVPQCGYCQSGMIMSAAALLKNNPRPTESEIRTGFTNICRCGTYNRIVAAVKAASSDSEDG